MTEHPTCPACGGYTDTAPPDCTDDDFVCFGTAIECRVAKIPRVARGLHVIAAAVLTERGAIFTLPPPARHCDLNQEMRDAGHDPMDPGNESGFLLSDGRFARRVPARHIAEEAGQILPGKGRHRELYSEDVW